MSINNAVKTASEFNRGNIAVLDDAMTRRLVASTVLTESSGGNLSVMNKQGYTGRYQAGAAWLAEAGYIKGGDQAVINAMKQDGYTNEWKWASAGGMTKFLNNPNNWIDGMNVEKYKSSAELQDQAFKTVSDKAYRTGLNRGDLSSNSTPEQVAGYLKARHIGGIGGASQAIKGLAGAKDANGTNSLKYFNDIAKNGDGLNQHAHRMDPTGQVQQTSQERVSILEREPAPIIRSGMRGDDVRELQAFLTAQGYDTKGADGIFGRNTQTALENFQREHNLNDDGVFGRNTQTELARLAPEKEVTREAVTPEVPNQEVQVGEPTVQAPETTAPEAGAAGGKASESEEKLATILASIEAVNNSIKELTPEERDQLRQRLDAAMIDGQSQGVTFKFSPKEQGGSTGELLLGALGVAAAGLSNSQHKDWALVGGVVGSLAQWGLSKLRGDTSVDVNGAHGPTMTVGGHQHSMDFKKVGGLDHYANSDNTLLGKLDAAEDKFTIFHRNGNKLDEVGTINDVSKQSIINLQQTEAVRNLEPGKAVQAQGQTL